MRLIWTTLALIAVSAASTAAYAADCKGEVAAALERQRKTSAFRMKTSMITEEGKVHMTVDYLLPDRMRQVVSSAADPTPVETILVNHLAFSRRKGQPWTLLNAHLTSELAHQLQETVGDDPGKLGEFECLGKKPVDGKQMLAYLGENNTANPQVKNQPKLPNRPVRVIYVDPVTGLPMRSIFARADKLDKPIFETTYSYPSDIKIDMPPVREKNPSQ
jgi:hypothetical protein